MLGLTYLHNLFIHDLLEYFSNAGFYLHKNKLQVK